MVNPSIIQDGPYWRSRAETLRRAAAHEDILRPETKERMLEMARDCDARAMRAEKRDGRMGNANASNRRRRDQARRATA